MKLKTLKDFKKPSMGRWVGTELVVIDMFKDELKKEAIKWIKEIAGPEKINIQHIVFKRKDSEHYEITSPDVDIETEQWAIAQIGWIIHFFDLTEDEFKGRKEI